MEGSGGFFGGKIVAKVTLSRGIGRGLKRGHADKDKTYTDYADNKDKTLVGSPLPPVTLHLILTNTGALPVTVSIFDFDSDLGNFAVDPDHLTIPPGQNAEPTTMVSQLGVGSDLIPFKVTLKLDGARESETVQVRVIHTGDAGAQLRMRELGPEPSPPLDGRDRRHLTRVSDAKLLGRFPHAR